MSQNDSLTEHVYVISDLHLGGRGPDWTPKRSGGAHPDRRMCGVRAQEQLEAFLKDLALLAQSTSGPHIHLVINGDFVDFLAEADPDDGAFKGFQDDAGKAQATLARIMNTPRTGTSGNPTETGCKEVFEALVQFLKMPRAKLTILVGNHDLELAWKSCDDLLREYLTGKNKARDDKLAIDTSGHPLVLGQLWIEHGNRYDIWNYANYSRLREATTSKNKTAKFQHPLGSDLVVKVINPEKSAHPFIDLLKPETRGVLPLLWYLLPPSKRKALLDQIPVARLALGAVAQKLGLRAPVVPERSASAEGSAKTSSDTSSATIPEGRDALFDTEELDALPLLKDLLVEELRCLDPMTTVHGPSSSAGQDAKTALLKDMEAFFLVISPNGNSLVDYEGYNSARRKEVLREIRIVIDRLQTDSVDQLAVHTEKSKYWDAFLKIIEGRNRVRNGKLVRKTDTVLLGHSHVMKHMSHKFQNDNEKVYYINTGTWADLMLFPAQSEVAEHEQVIQEMITDILNKRHEEYLHRLPSYALIKLNNNIVEDRKLYIFHESIRQSIEVQADVPMTLSELADKVKNSGSRPATEQPSTSI